MRTGKQAIHTNLMSGVGVRVESALRPMSRRS